MIWYDMVWYGMVKYGMVWYGGHSHTSGEIALFVPNIFTGAQRGSSVKTLPDIRVFVSDGKFPVPSVSVDTQPVEFCIGFSFQFSSKPMVG